eukprot:TRINITY_DN43895_c0_g1_i1.p1 TRINITY_DN43895_c0_g1~~TRINITY_DN43895_c0_g1_i1.p1  ORF type:complete len:748 (+),score=119.89 TRINITY_DN43895_c0_g1_i1:139-2382(+)
MAPPAPTCGLDLVTSLNLAMPREFLLQVEDELEAFCKLVSDKRRSEATVTDAGNGAGALTRFSGNAMEEQLVFPALAPNYEVLLVAAARRYGLSAAAKEHGRGRRVVRVWAPTLGPAPALPQLCFADFLRVQRPPGPSPLAQADKDVAHQLPGEASVADKDTEPVGTDKVKGQTWCLHRLRLRLWAAQLAATDLGTGGAVAVSTPAAAVSEGEGLSSAAPQQTGDDEDEAALQQKFDAIFSAKSRDVACSDGAKQSDSDNDRKHGDGSAGARKRGRGFEEKAAAEAAAAAEPTVQLRHSYDRFGPLARTRVYLRDDFVRAMWPTARLPRGMDPPVIWRPEWRVGPEDPGAESAAWGGVLSWAIEPDQFSFGQGFELSLRDGPGPQANRAGSKRGIDDDTDEECKERDENDFVLCFRRGRGEWHFAAAHRGRRGAEKQKTVTDCSDRVGTRQMFWVACVESRKDGKHYVLVGGVPGLLTDHFFVAKIGRRYPLSHAGFSYLPEPGKAAFGGGSSSGHVIVESITVYPHSLTGELPFVSLRFVEERPSDYPSESALAVCVIEEVADLVEPAELDVASARSQHDDGEVKVELSDDDKGLGAERTPCIPGDTASEAEQLGTKKADSGEDGEAKSVGSRSGSRVLLVRKAPLSSTEADASRLLKWSETARRECGLVSLVRSEEDNAKRLDRRARMRATAPVLASGGLTAPSSWEDPPELLLPEGDSNGNCTVEPAVVKSDSLDDVKRDPFAV